MTNELWPGYPATYPSDAYLPGGDRCTCTGREDDPKCPEHGQEAQCDPAVTTETEPEKCPSSHTSGLRVLSVSPEWQQVYDRIGGLCCRWMTMVGPLTGGVVEQAYRLRDEIMAVVVAHSSEAHHRLEARLSAAEADADQLAYMLERTWPSKADFAFTAKQRLEHHRSVVAARSEGQERSTAE